MDHWLIILDGYGDRGRESGDVVTNDGEVIGTWTADAEDHCSFTPLGAAEPIIWQPFLGLFCRDVADWHAKKEAVQLAESNLPNTGVGHDEIP